MSDSLRVRLDDVDDVDDGSDGSDVNGGFSDAEIARLGASAPTGGRFHPWDEFDQNEKASPKNRFPIPLNEYDKSLLHHYASLRRTSMANAAVMLIRKTALAEVKAYERGQRRTQKRRAARAERQANEEREAG